MQWLIAVLREPVVALAQTAAAALALAVAQRLRARARRLDARVAALEDVDTRPSESSSTPSPVDSPMYPGPSAQ